MSTTIVTYTDNSLPEDFARLVRRKLVQAAEGKPIVCVSQEPIDWRPYAGDSHVVSICIGHIGRSHLSLYRQILMGVESARTDVVALAEHDCLYTPEHFNWTPPNLTTFYYNVEHWFLQWTGRRAGEFSYQRRRVLSNLIVGRDICATACREKVWMLEHGWMIKPGAAGACEPGCLPLEEQMIKVPTEQMMRASLPCEPGVCDDRDEYRAALNQFKDLGKEIGRYQAEAFRTTQPNLDIRNGHNFSGGRKGSSVTRTLPPWGTLQEVACA